MPRQPRIDLPGYLYHVITRGIERKSIFKDTHDYKTFTGKLAEVIAETGGTCFAWVLMPNHAHILLRSGRTGLADMMRSLLTGYAMYYNKRHKRSGYLFQNRYKATLCDGDAYLMALVRYIHLNPIKARLVNTLEQLDHFSMCGHTVMMGIGKAIWQDTDAVLGLFGNTVSAARQAYREYIREGISGSGDFEGGGLMRSISHGNGDFLRGKVPDHIKYDERILGESNFVDSIYLKIGDLKEDDKEQYTFEEVLDIIARKEGIDKTVLCSKNRAWQVEQARKLAVFIGVGKLGLTNTAVGRIFKMTPGGITLILKREKNYFEKIKKKNIKELMS